MDDKIERRSFMRGAGAIVGATATVALNETPAHAEAAPPTGSKLMTYDPKPLSLDPKAIKGISEKVFGQPLREQLPRRGETPRRYQRSACRARLRQDAELRHQRPEA